MSAPAPTPFATLSILLLLLLLLTYGSKVGNTIVAASAVAVIPVIRKKYELALLRRDQNLIVEKETNKQHNVEKVENIKYHYLHSKTALPVSSII